MSRAQTGLVRTGRGWMPRLTGMRLLLVSRNVEEAELLEELLRDAGYSDILSTHDADGVRHLCESCEPDLVLLDLQMARRSGFEVLAEIREFLLEPENLPVLVVSEDATRVARQRALSLGARDFVAKSIDPPELLLRIRNLLQTRQLEQQLREQNTLLDEAVRERTAELEQARLESLTILASVAEYHDDDTRQHTQRVGLTAALIAEALGLPEQHSAMIRDAAPLHDIGKIGISQQILVKPGQLTDEERFGMMRHVEIGAQLLAPAGSPVLRLAAEIARTHHERWDGKGYLAGLEAEGIPLSGRITTVADVFDALTHERPYKPAWEPERAVAEITNQAGRQFDPRVVEAFVALDPYALLQRFVDEAADTVV
jgi:putative nucleotidyltransferase with HDIG domain